MTHRPISKTFYNWKKQISQRAVTQSDGDEAVEYGKVWNTDHYSESVVDDGSTNVHIATGSDDKIKLSFRIVTGGDAIIQLVETPTISSNGTELDSYNLNRVDEIASSTVIYSDATFSSGTTIEDQYIPGGVKQFSRGGELIHRFIPKKNSSYVLKVTNKSGGSTFIGVKVEHEVR